MSTAAAASPSSLSSYLSGHADFDGVDSPSSPLASLYSSLSSLRASNPSAYRANVDWWRKILTDVTWKGAQRNTKGKGKGKQRDDDRLLLHVDEQMLDDWSLEHVGRPMGIGTVVLDMASTSHLIQLNHYLTTTTPISGPSKVTSSTRTYIPTARAVVGFVMGKPLWWALSNLGITGGGEDDDEDEVREWKKARGSWVVYENVERAASSYLEAHYSQATLSPLDSLLPLATFRARFLSANPNLTERDIQIVLKYLSRDRRVAQVDKGIVKLAATEGEEVEQITEQDRGLVAIKETHDRLEGQVKELERRIAECDTKITQHLRASQKSQALNALKLKKQLAEILNKRLDSLSTLSSILLKIEQTSGDISILNSYETSTKVLKDLLADPRLQRERVEGTMDRLEEAVADQREIDEVVKDGGERMRIAAGQEDLEEAELEEEMKRLEEEEKREREREEEEAAIKERQRRKEREEQVEREKVKRQQREEEEEERRRRAREAAEIARLREEVEEKKRVRKTEEQDRTDQTEVVPEEETSGEKEAITTA